MHPCKSCTGLEMRHADLLKLCKCLGLCPDSGLYFDRQLPESADLCWHGHVGVLFKHSARVDHTPSPRTRSASTLQTQRHSSSSLCRVRNFHIASIGDLCAHPGVCLGLSFDSRHFDQQATDQVISTRLKSSHRATSQVSKFTLSLCWLDVECSPVFSFHCTIRGIGD